MTDMILNVRITADGTQLVGQMSSAQVEAAQLKQSMTGAATGTDQLTRAATAATAAERGATAATDALARSQRTAQTSTQGLTQAAQAQQRALAASQAGATSTGGAHQTAAQQVLAFVEQVGAAPSVLDALTGSAEGSGGAVDGLTESGGLAENALGGLAGLVGGVLGVALTAIVPIVIEFVGELFKTAEASEAAREGSARLAEEMDDLSSFFDLATGAINRQNIALIANARLKNDDKIKELEAIQRARATRIRGIFERSDDDQFFTVGGAVGVSRGTTTRVPGSPDLRNAVIAARGNQLAIDQALLEIARGDGPNATRAREISDARALATGTARELRDLRLREESFASGRLAAELLDPDEPRRTRPTRSRGDRSGDAAARRQAAELERIRDFADRAGDAIERINDRWTDQPTLIQQANSATRDLNNIIEEAQEKLRTRGLGAAEVLELTEVIADARTGLTNVQSGLLRPFNEMIEAGQRQRELQLLVLQGREREADVLARVRDLQDKGVEVTAAQRGEIERIVDGEQMINELLDRREEIIGTYQASLGDLRSSIEDLFSGGNLAEFGRSLTDNARRLRGRLLTEQLFGEGFRNLEEQVRRKTGLEGAVDVLDVQTRGAATAMESVGEAAIGLANTLRQASTIASTAGEPIEATIARDTTRFLDQIQRDMEAWSANYIDALQQGEDPNNRDIRVGGERESASRRPTLTTMSSSEYFREVARVLANPIIDQLTRLDETLGTRLAGRLGGVIQGGIEGYLTAGPVGGVLGALRGIEGLPDDISAGLDKAFKGAETGTQIDQLFGAFGIKSSKTGAQLGGALGGAIGGPIGEIVGSILGGITGGLLKSAKTGSATITNATGDATVSGNNKQFKQQSSALASTVQDTLRNIADQLGGELGDFAVSIGVRDGNIRVDPSGRGNTRTKRGALDFGEDSEGALRAAVLDAIGDGGIDGLSAAIEKALKSSSNLERALREALKVQEVEDIVGGIGSALERQFRQFEAQAKDRVRIATEYGFDVTKIEARNAEDRAKLIEQILGDRVGALQQLLQDFKFGDLFEGSAADRRTALIAETAKARADAEAGVDGAAQRLAELSRQLVETSREAFGTAGPEFATDRTEAISAAERVIQIENERIRATQETALGTRAAVEASNVLLNENNDLLAQIVASLSGASGVAGAQIRNAVIASDVSRQVDLR